MSEQDWRMTFLGNEARAALRATGIFPPNYPARDMDMVAHALFEMAQRLRDERKAADMVEKLNDVQAENLRRRGIDEKEARR